MKQLMMLWKKQTLKPCILPEGFTIRSYREGDEQAWIDVCTDGLDTGSWTISDFRKRMLEDEGVYPEGIFFVTDKAGRIAGTATGLLKSEPELGYVHMVSIHSDYRGLGLAKPLNVQVLNYLVKKGRVKITLDTDDIRIPAIKVYLWLGFLPVLHDEDMEERWLQIMKKIGLRELPVFTMDCNNMKILKWQE